MECVVVEGVADGRGAVKCADEIEGSGLVDVRGSGAWVWVRGRDGSADEGGAGVLYCPSLGAGWCKSFVPTKPIS